MSETTVNSTTTIDLSSLVLEACQHDPGSPQRQRLLTEIIRQVQRSGKVWRDYQIPLEQYHEALQSTWIWFCQNIEKYDPMRANPITWFNCILKFRIKDIRRKQVQYEMHFQPNCCCHGSSDKMLDLIDRLPAPELDQSEEMLTDLCTWLDEDRSNLVQKTVRNYPEINVYVLITRRLPTEHQVSWQVLSQEFGVSVSTLSSFYQRQCVPVLREFVRSQGWFGN
jgi:DNA-directed RNA polymerase specialized sigma24 family protein